MDIRKILILAAALSGATAIHPAIAAEDKTPPAASGAQPSAAGQKEPGSIESYPANHRAEAVKKAKSSMAAFDARMEKWKKETKEEREKAIEDIKAQRQEVAKLYEELKHATSETWDDVKARFVKSYDGLEEKLDNAEEKFNKAEEKEDTSEKSSGMEKK